MTEPWRELTFTEPTCIHGRDIQGHCDLCAAEMDEAFGPAN